MKDNKAPVRKSTGPNRIESVVPFLKLSKSVSGVRSSLFFTTWILMSENVSAMDIITNPQRRTAARFEG